MEKRNPTEIFIPLIIAALIIFLLDRANVFLSLRVFMENIISPGAHQVQNISALPIFSASKITELTQERNTLLEKVSQLANLQRENEDLRLQLGIAKELPSRRLLLAHVLATARYFIIDKGSDDGVKEGESVIFKNIFVGKVVLVSKKTSRVFLPIEKDNTVGVITSKTHAKGLMKGDGENAILTEVILSEQLHEGDTATTTGDLDEHGVGIQPGLLIGTLAEIHKSVNQLYQEAKLNPLIDYKTLSDVFIVL